MLTNIAHAAFSALFPQTCLVCDSSSHAPICHRCEFPSLELEQYPDRCPVCFERSVCSKLCPSCQRPWPLVNSWRFLWNYSGNARDVCVSMKYKPSPLLIEISAAHLASALPRLFTTQSWDYLIAIPSSADGLKRRKFNHVELLCWHLMRATKVPLLKKALLLNRERRAQASLSNRARMRSVSTRFSVSEYAKSRVRNTRILLIDDVSTTAATLTSAAVALRSSGAAQLDTLTMCRSPTWRRYLRVLERSFRTKTPITS